MDRPDAGDLSDVIGAWAVADSPRLLAGVSVIDATTTRTGTCGAYLAALGAEVVLLENAAEGTAGDLGEDREYAFRHAGKRRVRVDLRNADDCSRIRSLLRDADLFVLGPDYADWESAGFGPEAIRKQHPGLTTLTLTEFGRTGPRRDWQATDPVHMAMSGFLSRSGLPGRPPLIPPADMAIEGACVQVAWCALAALWRRQRDGAGDDIDFSIFDSTVQMLDPHFGPSGTAAAADGAPPPRGRVEAPYYPTFPVQDGFVRIVCIATRQWRALYEWMGSPEAFADPAFDNTGVRFREAARINAEIGRFFRQFTVATLLQEGQRRGLPIAPVLSLSEVSSSDHYRQRGAIRDVSEGDAHWPTPRGYVEIDLPVATAGARARERTLMPGALPLADLRVLDLGVIVMGGEAARLFADQGADVLKIESRAFADGSRGGAPMIRAFAVGHRNLRSVGLNLRSPEGVELFRRLAANADVVLNNFKPGTMERLGIGYDALSAINPGLVMVSCSAFGDTGPWREWMGYGPLVRAASGLAGLWRYEDEPNRFGDTALTYPDHFAARVVDVAALSGLLHRQRTGLGCHVRCSQAETLLMVLSNHLLAANAGRTLEAPDTPWGVFPCAGDDEWCVVTVRSDREWRNLGVAVGDSAFVQRSAFSTSQGRREHRAEIAAWLSAWTIRHTPAQAAALLQQASVPAGAMQRGGDLLDDPQLAARAQFRVLDQPGLPTPLHVENGPAIFASGVTPPDRPAPFMGQHTKVACAEWLGLSDADLTQLLSCGALEAYA